MALKDFPQVSWGGSRGRGKKRAKAEVPPTLELGVGQMRQKTQDMLQALIPNEQKRKVPNDIWARMDASQRIEELTGHSLDNCRDILDLPIEVAVKSPTVMNGKVGIIRAILQLVARVGIESNRLRQMQEEVLGKLIDDFDQEEACSPETKRAN